MLSGREQLVKKINEQETLGKTLKDRQKTTANVHVDGKKQMRLWKDLLRQMEMKRKHRNKKRELQMECKF